MCYFSKLEHKATTTKTVKTFFCLHVHAHTHTHTRSRSQQDSVDYSWIFDAKELLPSVMWDIRFEAKELRFEAKDIRFEFWC